MPSGRGERASGRRNKTANFLSGCTERWTDPREANHSEQLARGGGGRGAVSSRAQVRESVLSVQRWAAAMQPVPRAEPMAQDPVRSVVTMHCIWLSCWETNIRSLSSGFAQSACSCIQMQNVLARVPGSVGAKLHPLTTLSSTDAVDRRLFRAASGHCVHSFVLSMRTGNCYAQAASVFLPFCLQYHTSQAYKQAQGKTVKRVQQV